MSKYTSLVAVDVTPTAPPGVQSVKTAIPGNLPHGQSFDAIFGGLPQTATPASRDLVVAALALLAAVILVAIARTRERPRISRAELR